MKSHTEVEDINHLLVIERCVHARLRACVCGHVRRCMVQCSREETEPPVLDVVSRSVLCLPFFEL